MAQRALALLTLLTCCVVAFAFQPDLRAQPSGALYGTALVGGTWTLFREDVNTGAVTHVADIASGTTLGASQSAFDPAGHRYFTWASNSTQAPYLFRLYGVNVNTGAVTSATAEVDYYNFGAPQFDGLPAAVPVLTVPAQLVTVVLLLVVAGWMLLERVVNVNAE